MTKKLEEILERNLPVYINQEAENNEVEFVCINKIWSGEEFLKKFKYGDRFSIMDYPELEDQVDFSKVEKYCLVDEEGKPTLSLSEAIQFTPNLKVPFIDMNISSDTGVPISILITFDDKDHIITYIPRRGNTLRLDNNKTIEESGLFNFNWQDKEVLEKSDLLYIVKNVNRPALTKYLLRDIYEAFQNESESTNIVQIDRKSCIDEFETKVTIREKE